MSIATEISRLTTAKSDIKTAIEAKGVTVGTAKLDAYSELIDTIQVNGGQWTPNADWIDISSVNNNEINLLVSDGGVGIAFAVTTASGTYSIDWGDGVVETSRASSTTYSHQYTIGSGQSVNGGQYTCFKIRIYGATGNITRFQMKQHPSYTQATNAPLLWAVFGTVSITDYSNTFYTLLAVSCKELQSITIPSFASCSSTANMFYLSYSLSNVILPTSWGSITDVSYMFYSCYSLKSLTLPTSWGSIANVSYMFASCASLSNVILPTSWGSITNTSNMFNFASLSSITLPTSWGSITNTSNMFAACVSLRILNNLNYLGHQTTASDFTNILQNAQALSGVLTVASKLTKIGIQGASGKLNLSTGLRLTNGANTWTGTSPHIDVSYCSFDATALNTLFGDLETIAGKTIKITGNAGSATCTTSIATNKGWTVTN